MILAVDERVPYWNDAFGHLGEVRPFAGRKLTPNLVKDADALIVRSITAVNAALLDGSSVRFVGTASVGMDNLDQNYLKSRGIHFTNAAGSNANAVAQYFVAALLVVAQRRGWNLHRTSLGIVGVGHIGSLVEKKARALGMEVQLCDPPLRESTGDSRYRDLRDILDVDILTFHVPLTSEGPYPTRHMVDRSLLQQLTPRQFLINTSRGPVFAGPDLKLGITQAKIAGAVLDVWEGEPRIDFSLLDKTEIGTQHIAGFSFDGKVRGTEMILQELCNFFGLAKQWETRGLYPAARRIRPRKGTSGQDALLSLVLQAYDILQDDHKLRDLKDLPPEKAAPAFDRLRDQYVFRPEFHHFVVELTGSESDLATCVEGLGFQVSLDGSPSAGE